MFRMVRENAPELRSIVLPYEAKPMAEPGTLKRFSSLMTNASSSSNVYGSDGTHRSLSTASSIVSEKSRQMLRKGSEKVKSLAQASSELMDDKKNKLAKLEELVKDKYAFLRNKL